MIIAWQRQKRRVRRMSKRLMQSTQIESRRRQALKGWAEHSLFRFQTALWVSVTGAIWMSRRRKSKQSERGSLVAEILASLWIMQRWRQVVRRTSALIKNKELEHRDAY